jgi:hypothetical protein
MSISKKWVADVANQEAVLSRYRSPDIPTTQAIADELGTTFHNVSHVLKHNMPEAERKALAKVRYSASKTGDKNPMRGKTEDAHHNWKGDCEDGRGYLTRIQDGKRQFVHRIVMAEALGLEVLPDSMDVHHIDNDPRNNSIDNLALLTPAGHKAVHYMQATDSILLRSRKSTIADALKYMTSPSQTMPATKPAE